MRSSQRNCSLVFFSHLAVLWAPWENATVVQNVILDALFSSMHRPIKHFIALQLPGNYVILPCLHFVHKESKHEYNQSFSSLRDQLSILTSVMSPTVLHLLLPFQNVNICLCIIRGLIQSIGHCFIQGRLNMEILESSLCITGIILIILCHVYPFFLFLELHLFYFSVCIICFLVSLFQY